MVVLTANALVGYEVAVVGAGITGLSSALELARRGIGPVVVIERTGIAAEASGVQPGGVRQQWGTRVNCLLARESAEYYRDLPGRLESPLDPVLEACGYIFLAHSEPQLQRLRADVDLQNAAGVPSSILTPTQAAAVVPDLRITSVTGAAWCSEDGYFDRPQSVVEAYAQAAERAGVSIVIADVTNVRSAAHGWTLELSDGSALSAPKVVIAAGSDAPPLTAPLGIELPIRKDRRFLFLSEPIRERLLEPLVVSAERAFAAKQLANGRVLASDLTADGEDAPTVDDRRRAIREHIDELLPRLQYVSLPVVVEGVYDTTPDNQPLVAEIDADLWVSAGYSGHGFMLAPAISRRLAAAIGGEPIDDLLSAFALTRFSDPQLVYETAVV